MTAAHALLSASGARRWLACPPSARLEEQLPESPSAYAAEGTLAHSIAELKVRKLLMNLPTKSFNASLKKLQAEELYNEEMLRHTDTYADYIAQLVHSYTSPPYLAVEKRLDFSRWVPEGFGTGDCVVIGGETMHVIDFKYGKGVPVSAEENPQMMLYAVGALEAYSMLYNIQTVHLAVVQPRLDTISEWTTSVTQLSCWAANYVAPLAQLAFAGRGEYSPGDHCRFCRAKATCRARADKHTVLEDFKTLRPPLISNEEVGQLLERAKDLAKWAADLEEYALGECLAGRSIAGWKAVEGRSTRQFIDHDAAFSVLRQSGIEDAMLYERKPITLAATEKLLGKARFRELLSAHVNMPPGKPTLVTVTDKREAITRTGATDDFKIDNGGTEE